MRVDHKSSSRNNLIGVSLVVNQLCETWNGVLPHLTTHKLTQQDKYLKWDVKMIRNVLCFVIMFYSIRFSNTMHISLVWH